MESDFLVVGSGIAGLSFALKVASLGSVVLVTKKGKVDTATNLAQGGIAAVLSDKDSKDTHIQDTLQAGAGLCDESVVEMVVESGPDRVKELMKLGVGFVSSDSDSSGLDLGKEGGHSQRRVAHAYDLTGKEIERALIENAKDNPRITLFENHTAVDLLLSGSCSAEQGESGRCVGAYVLEPNGEVVPYQAKMTVLCSGGAGKVYLYTTNPDIATGDGIAMAFRAGAMISNLEFVQFHPTCLYHSQAKNFLISEAVRGEGGILLDGNGKRFIQKYDKRGELGTRDSVARAIDKEMKISGADCVYLDISHKSRNFLKTRFPTIYTRCMEYGIDIASDPIPVVPAAHYMCGGVKTNKDGCTSIDGLMALGETACTGLHGGNRLASNSLLEAVVYAERAYQYCAKQWDTLKHETVVQVDEWKSGKAETLDEEILINNNWDLIRRVMWNYVGIVRKTNRLLLAKNRVEEIYQEIEQHYLDYFVTANMVELRNIALLAKLIILQAIERKESRGLHYNVDFPEKMSGSVDSCLRKRTSDGGWSIELC